METTISFDLVSPENLVFNDKVGMIIVPGKEGDIGILPGHSKLLSSLRPGRVMVYGESKNLLKSFFVSAGFVEINPQKCIVLGEEVQEMTALDKNTIEQEIRDLENKTEIDTSKFIKIESLKISVRDLSKEDIENRGDIKFRLAVHTEIWEQEHLTLYYYSDAVDFSEDTKQLQQGPPIHYFQNRKAGSVAGKSN